MTEAQEILRDIETELIPLLTRFMRTHAARWDGGHTESGKHLKTFQRSLAQHVYKRQPLPLMESEDE